jgi:hypothetical protein
VFEYGFLVGGCVGVCIFFVVLDWGVGFVECGGVVCIWVWIFDSFGGGVLQYRCC